MFRVFGGWGLRDVQREDHREPGYGPPPKVLDLHQESQQYAGWEQWSYDKCWPLFAGSKSGSKVSTATAEVPSTPPPDPVHAAQHRPESQHKLNLHPGSRESSNKYCANTMLYLTRCRRPNIHRGRNAVPDNVDLAWL